MHHRVHAAHRAHPLAPKLLLRPNHALLDTQRSTDTQIFTYTLTIAHTPSCTVHTLTPLIPFDGAWAAGSGMKEKENPGK